MPEAMTYVRWPLLRAEGHYPNCRISLLIFIISSCLFSSRLARFIEKIQVR